MLYLFKRFFWLPLFLLLSVNPAHAITGLFDQNPFKDSGPVPVEEAFVLSFYQEGNSLKLLWDMPDDYYLYRDRIELKPGTTTEIAARNNAPAVLKDDPLFGQVWVYYKQAEVDLTLNSSSQEGQADMITLTYQGCWEGGVCYPPVTKEIPINAFQPVSADVIAQQAKVATSAASTTTSSAPALTEQDQFAQMLSQGSIFVILGAFFVAGLALSFTPCVFPMIPILSSIIAGQGRHVSAGKGFALSLVYVLAVSVTYTIAGVLAGLFGENIQALFQNPWIISAFSLIFVLLSLSMFGFYELQLPSSLQTKLSNASHSQQGGTVAGVAIMGFLSALIVGPCMAAPLAGALIYIGQTGDPILGGSALFSMSLGMGVPLLLVGASAGKLLPHAGLWMNKVKAVFGVLLLLLAVWMLDRIVPTIVTMWLTAIILIVSAVYMGVLSSAKSTKESLAKGVGLIVLLYAVSLMAGALAGGNSLIYPLKAFAGGQAQQNQGLPFINVTTPEALERELAQAKSLGQPVMLDFYADWCVACIELEVVTFADSAVQTALKPYRVIKVDVTANDEPAKALNKAYSVIGPPALIFFNAQGEKLDHKTLIGVIQPEVFLSHISDI